MFEKKVRYYDQHFSFGLKIEQRQDELKCVRCNKTKSHRHSLVHVQTFRIECRSRVMYSFISTRNTILLAYIEIVIHMKSTFSSDRNTQSNSVVINGN